MCTSKWCVIFTFLSARTPLASRWRGSAGAVPEEEKGPGDTRETRAAPLRLVKGCFPVVSEVPLQVLDDVG